jgi:hypothetical protein
MDARVASGQSSPSSEQPSVRSSSSAILITSRLFETDRRFGRSSSWRRTIGGRRRLRESEPKAYLCRCPRLKLWQCLMGVATAEMVSKEDTRSLLPRRVVGEALMTESIVPRGVPRAPQSPLRSLRHLLLMVAQVAEFSPPRYS